MKAKLGGNVVIWPVQNGQMGYDVLSAHNNWISGHTDAVNRLLKSLSQAQEYFVNHPEDSRAIIKKRLNYSDEQMAGLAAQHIYSLSLFQSLVVAMEDEARWMISHSLTAEKNIPDFMDYIYLDGLHTVKPSVVNIIH